MENLSQTIGKKLYHEVSFNTIINTYSKNGQVGSIQASESWFGWTTELGLKPNEIRLMALMEMYANCFEWNAAHHTEAFLNIQESKVVYPTTACYNAVMNDWFHSGEFDEAKRVKDIIAKMYKLYKMEKNKKIKPNTRS